jgi:hypothetical protein
VKPFTEEKDFIERSGRRDFEKRRSRWSVDDGEDYTLFYTRSGFSKNGG